MKKQIATLGLSLIAILSLSAAADTNTAKQSTHIDFNKMIDDNNTSDLQRSLDTRMADKDSAKDVKVNADKSKVLDFVDVEIGLGEDRPVVDRRTNSVDGATVAPEYFTPN